MATNLVRPEEGEGHEVAAGDVANLGPEDAVERDGGGEDAAGGGGGEVVQEGREIEDEDGPEGNRDDHQEVAVPRVEAVTAALLENGISTLNTLS